MKISPILPPAQKLPSPLGEDRTPFVLAKQLETPIWIFDIDTARIIFANLPACKLWGADNEAILLTRDMAKDMSSSVKKRLKQYQNDFLDGETTFNELWTLYPKGKPKSVMVLYRGYALPNGRMAMLCEVVGEAKDTPENLRSAEALLHTDVMITLFGGDGLPLYQNPAARNAALSPKMKCDALFADPNDFQSLQTKVDMLGEYRVVAKVNTASGERWHDVSAKKCLDAVSGQPAVLMTAIDVSELKEARDAARHMADRDLLTNLYNRAFLQSHLAQLASHPIKRDCAVICFDIDRFKLVNDHFGHASGDFVLQNVAERITQAMHKNDLAARLGGDEFAILLQDKHTKEEISAKIAMLRKAISSPILHGAFRIDVTVSIGIAFFSPHLTEFTEVLREADIALYASKQAGRDSATFYTMEMGAAALARDQLETELKYAVQRGEFILHYQPRLEIESGTIVGVEALVRWLHPERGIIMPNEFIHICEETRLIEDLGRIVLELGCAQAIAWQCAGLDLNVSINVSPKQFSDDFFIETLTSLAELPNFPTGKIELEITESLLIGDHNFIAEKLHAISKIGYLIAIDDFGTGYSNLSYISRFPLTCLKIDRSFIEQLPETGPIIQLILTLGNQIGATIVSEGIETREQLNWLSKNKCEQAQGYHISHPLTPENLAMFLEKSEWNTLSTR